jgi:predicted PurR-regulated permease PerM
MFLLLLARARIRRFLVSIWPGDSQEADTVLDNGQRLVFKFLGGRLIIMGLLSVFYAIGFLIFGLPNAIPVAILAGTLSLIPYVGNVIGGLVAVAFGFALGDGLTVVLGVVGTMSLAQVLENNLLQPWIIGSQVSMNPLFTFLSIVGFGLIWGVAGTVIAVPLVSVLREISSQIPSLEPLAEVTGLDN